MTYNWEDKTIVIVEDNDVNYLLLKKQLRKTKATIAWLKNGLDSVNYIKDKKPADIVLMDVRMPIMDGIEATKLIKEILPDLPIIMQTACVIGSDYEDVKSSGCEDYIFKPIISADLLEKIKTYI